MFIAVGIGNTNTVIGQVDGREQLVHRVPTNTFKTTSDSASLLNTLFSQYAVGTEKPEGSILASVVPALTKPFALALSDFTGKQPLVADTRIHTQLDFSGYNGLLGSDRIAVCTAAWCRCHTPCIVIDLGTAITFNIVGPDAVFLGGAILPGLRMGLDALSRNTAQLPETVLMEPFGAIGRNTEECLLAGAYYGTASMVDGMIGRVTKALHPNTKIFLTGGGAAAILPLIETTVTYAPDLLLEGLAALYRLNAVSA